MATVTRVEVGNKPPTAADVLEYAAQLINLFGWNRKVKDGVESNEVAGYGLHDAIGEACTRLSQSVSGRAEKDWTVRTKDGLTANLRERATSALMNVINSGPRVKKWPDDKAWENAPKRTSVQVLNVLNKAREEVLSGG